MLILSADDVRRALPIGAAIEAMKEAFAALSDGKAHVPVRAHLPIEPHDGVTLVMPAYVRQPRQQALAVKVVSLLDHNAERGLARIQAAVLVIEPDTGRPAALLEGAALTAIRTGAASGAATDLLARPDSHVAAVFGAGVQARTQLEAVCTVRPIETVWVYDPNVEAVEKLIGQTMARDPIPRDVRVAPSPLQAVVDADVICTATTSKSPVFPDARLKPGVHISAVGSYQPDVQEIPGETVARSLLFVDSRRAALAETGDLIQPIQRGIITADHVHAELGELILGRATGRTSSDQITLFKSVGVAVQDAVAARVALERARRSKLGRQVPW